MKPPFTVDQFLENFARYNQTVYPMQIIMFGLALFAVSFLFWKVRHTDKKISGILAFFWLWMGIVYHIVFFSTINRAAYLFGLVFILQAGLFIYHGVIKDRLQFAFSGTVYSWGGVVFLFYALVAYLAMGYLFGHTYPHNPTFGAPCPTAIFTFGMLLLTTQPVKKILIVIPLLWAIIGFNAAIYLGIKEDVGLLIAGVSGSALLWLRDRKAVQK